MPEQTIETKPVDDFWTDAPVIYSITRQQLIEEGELVDLTDWASHKPGGMIGGFKVPVAVTRSVWEDLNAIPASQKAYQDLRGRAHDLLWMASNAAHRNTNEDTLPFKVLLSIKGSRRKLQTYKMVVGPDDDGSPCITILKPEED